MLETEIKKLTAAVEANTAALIGGAVAAPSAPKPAAAVGGSAAAAVTPAAAVAATAIDIPIEVPPVPAVAAATAVPVVEITLKQITEKVLALAKAKSRDVAFALLAEYGATKVPELKGKEAQFAEISEKIDALMAA